ncbi:MarR family winged helix-turn-helix transcriptional regulator [Georgenia subflava]|uniref:MarR family transcriptional regulator n=1 Tax=Georgenia subflava TaxID=1622177 RepID=A0A6N7EM91_9MICO|nr:MarR family transcriptional regulator [Georgenia subflava]MPV37635.1 MarR family transcriptional regulator [Georgenia subflava]
MGEAEGSVGEAEGVGADLQAAFATVLRWASRAAVQARLWAHEETAGLTPTDAWLVEALATQGPMRASALAAWQGVDKSTVTPQVRRLERAGLVDRTPDPQDGRAVLLRLSGRGREVRELVRRAGAGVIEEQLSSWDEDDRRTFAVLLARFAAGLAAEGREADHRPAPAPRV